MEKEKEMFQVYNVGSNEVYSVNDVLEKMKIVADYNAPTEYIQGKPSMIPTRRIDSNKIKNKLNWEAKTNIIDGLRLTYNWYLKHQNEFNK
jgi:GDP-L-fucose synthase